MLIHQNGGWVCGFIKLIFRGGEMAKRKERKWAVADCETDAFDGQAVAPFIWAVMTSEGEREIFWDTGEFVAFLREFDGICYAHNGGKFDWLMPGIVEHLEHGNVKIINSRLASAKLGKCELRDSFLCLPSALAKFGAKLEFNYEHVARRHSAKRKTQFKKEIEEYIIGDVAALFAPMEIFIAKFGFCLTQAGAALKTWEAMGGEKRRYGKAHDDIFRPFYFGGRCEVFEYGAPLRGQFQMFDIVSSYPAAMEKMHPCGTDYYTSGDYQNAPGASFWVLDADSKGAFPKKEKLATTFPHRRDIYHVTGWELRAALETGTATIYSAIGYIPRREESLKPYIQRFFADKAEAEEKGDKAGREIAKIFLNSLYGKYGSNPENYKDYKIIPAGELFAIDPIFKTRKHGPEWGLELMSGDFDIISRPAQNPQYYDVALAASVTGYARAELWRAICNSTRPMYCDTDSLLCERMDYNIGKNLGQWKKEHDVYAAYIAGKKLYALNIGDGQYKTAHKGVSKMDVELEDIIRACKGEVVDIMRSAPSIKINGKQTFINRRIKKT